MLLCQARSLSAEPCERIISLAPSITESVFELGLGSQIVGVTRFCRYPSEAQAIQRIGGFYDVNIEAVVRAKPTHVFTLREHAETIRSLRMLGIPVIELDHSRVRGIKDGLLIIGRTCDREQIARERLADLTRRESALSERISSYRPLRTLVSVGRSHESSGAPSVFVSGSDGFYTDILVLAGGTNVNARTTISIPTVSEEGLRSLAPEAIVEIINVDDALDADAARAFWKRFPTLPAVSRGKVIIAADEFASIPGPRYILLAEKLARELHTDSKPLGKE